MAIPQPQQETGFQPGEIITFYMLGFTIILTASVVVYYKCYASGERQRRSKKQQ